MRPTNMRLGRYDNHDENYGRTSSANYIYAYCTTRLGVLHSIWQSLCESVPHTSSEPVQSARTSCRHLGMRVGPDRHVDRGCSLSEGACILTASISPQRSCSTSHLELRHKVLTAVVNFIVKQIIQHQPVPRPSAALAYHVHARQSAFPTKLACTTVPPATITRGLRAVRCQSESISGPCTRAHEQLGRVEENTAKVNSMTAG